MVWPGMVNPSMATKCMTQIPVVAIDTVASSSHRTRGAPCEARARVVQRSPRKQPRVDITKPSTGVTGP